MLSISKLRTICCELYTKIQKMKAIHNLHQTPYLRNPPRIFAVGVFDAPGSGVTPDTLLAKFIKEVLAPHRSSVLHRVMLLRLPPPIR